MAEKVKDLTSVNCQLGAVLKFHNSVLLPMRGNNTSGGRMVISKPGDMSSQEFTIKPETHLGKCLLKKLMKKKRKTKSSWA